MDAIRLIFMAVPAGKSWSKMSGRQPETPGKNPLRIRLHRPTQTQHNLIRHLEAHTNRHQRIKGDERQHDPRTDDEHWRRLSHSCKQGIQLEIAGAS